MLNKNKINECSPIQDLIDEIEQKYVDFEKGIKTLDKLEKSLNNDINFLNLMSYLLENRTFQIKLFD
jgi:DNA repair exonuclease SbcCD ATPase subunit